MIKCVSGSKKLLTIFGGSESKQKQKSKLVGPHHGMSHGIYFYSPMLYFTSETQSYGKLWSEVGNF